MLLSNTPFPRNTIVQEKILTKALLQNGRMISRNSASRERPFIVFARNESARKSEQQAKAGDECPQSERAQHQRAIEILFEERGIILQAQHGDPVSERRVRKKAEIQHRRKRKENGEEQP